jgi:ABC-2 type transport system ATP-binding protein
MREPTNDDAERTEANSNDEPAIVTAELTKRYGETTAVEGLHLEVDAGSIYGFLGPNGAGKTTTMRMLTALTRPTSGSGTVAGVSITDRETLVDHIGYLPESPPIAEQLTAREQLEYYGGLCGMNDEERANRVETLLDRLDLADDADERIVTYPKGMRQKTGLIQAILAEPEVVFLDEPTSGLDPQSVSTVRNLLTELAADGTTVFLSTHILSVVEQVATDVGILYEGRLVQSGTPDDLLERLEVGADSTLEDVFLEVTTDEE